MSKLTAHLRKHLDGEVLAEASALNYFSTDGSIFKLTPRAIVYPRHTTDVRKVVRLTHQLAEKDQHLAITARGKGTDQGGAAIGTGIILETVAHMNKLLGFHKTDVVVQPGMLYGDLERTLHSHGRFLPPYPSSLEFSTLGGAVANNACGEKTVKYGPMRNFVKSLDVVLSNGQLIRAQKLSARELSHKKGQTDFEGEVYRALDGLIDDNQHVLKQVAERLRVSKNSAGYGLWHVKGRDGSFDLSKLLVGSQGTLGIVTSITLTTEVYNPDTHLLLGFFDDLAKFEQAVMELLPLKPSALELVDYHLLKFLRDNQPTMVEDIIIGEIPKIAIIIEFDDMRKRIKAKKVKSAIGVLDKYAVSGKSTTDPEEKERIWEIRRRAGAGVWHFLGDKQALPIIEDGVVPISRFKDFLDGVYKLLAKYDAEVAISGHAGDANLHLKPILDLSNLGDRQKMFKLMDEFYEMVIDLGGSTCGEHNDGRLRAPYLKDLYGEQMYQLFVQVKKIFDPHGVLNPNVKLDFTKDDMLPILRSEFSMKHLYDQLPHMP